jgi:hypothetical protein
MLERMQPAAHDGTPSVSSGGFPGAAIEVTANCTSTPCTKGVIWVILPGNESKDGSLDRGLGKVYQYTALPNGSDQMGYEWNSTDTWCASSFARPTIVNGQVFVPTYAVSVSTKTFTSCTQTTLSSGGPYPPGILMYQ